MRILQVNKFLYRKAGAEAYMLDLVDSLQKHGQEVGMWGTGERLQEVTGGYKKLQEVTIFEDLLVEPLNFDQREGLWRDLGKFGHMLWSAEAARKFERVVQQFKPDILHIHNIYHHISPSILKVAARYKVPVVATVHDWHLINPNYNLYDHGAICERQGWRAATHRCIKNSYAASLADVVEWNVHKWMRVYEKYVARYMVPTEFVKEKLVTAGFDAKKIELLPLSVGYFEARPPGLRRPSLPYILYAGRLTKEKGIYVLLEIAKRLPEIKFKIAGDGPERKNVECKMQNEELHNVELLGFVEKERLRQLIAGARLVVVPSLWYELSPLAILEAQAAGKVVVASRVGGIPDLIEPGKTGFLVESSNLPQWLDTIEKICYDEALLKRAGKAAQAYVKRVHDPEKHYEKIMEIYRTLSD